MAITISGENNNDRITAADGVIDTISGFNISGIITASSFTGDLTGDVTGNLTGNVTGNINNSTLLLQTGGIERARIDSNGDLNLGNNPTNQYGYKLNIQDSAIIYAQTASSGGTEAKWNLDSSDNNMTFGTVTSSDLRLVTSNVPRLTVKSGGSVGIGTDNPNNPLTIHGSGNQLYLKDTATNNIFQIRHAAGVAEFNSFGTGGVRRDFVFNQYASEVLRIDSSGRVLIGTTTEGFAEADDLTINSADHGGVTIRTPTNKEGNIAFSDTTSGTGEYSGLIRYRHSQDDLGLWTNSNLRLLITSDGKVGINDNNPDSQLVVKPVSGHSTAKVTSGDETTSIVMQAIQGSEGRFGMTSNHPLAIYTSGLERLRIDSSGNAILKAANAAFKSESSSSGDYVRLYAGSGTGKWDIYGNAQYLRITDNDGAGSVRLDTRLGVGSAASHAHLCSRITATGAIPTTGLIQTNNDNHALQLWNQSNSATYCGLILETRTSGASGWLIANEWKSTYAGDLVFRGRSGGTSSSERLRIDSSGKLGVGDFSSTSISQALHVRGSQPEIFLEHTGGQDMTLTTNDGMGQNGITVNGGFLSLAYNNKNIVMCRTGGNVGINETAPSEKLQIDGDILLGGQANSSESNYAIKFEYNQHQFAKIVGDGRDSTGYGDIDFYTSSGSGVSNLTQRMSIRADGKIGIVDATNNGTISAALHVINSTPEIRLTNTTQPNSADCGKIRITEYANSYMGGYMHYDGNSNVLHFGVHEPNDSSTSNDVNSISIDRDTGQVHLRYEGNTKLTTTSTGVIIDSGTSTLVKVTGDSSGTAGLRVGGDSGQSQCTGYVEVHQDETHGGGMFYNGDGSPSFATHESADYFSLYRASSGSRYSVMRWFHSSQDCEVQGNMTIDNGYTSGSTVLKVRADSSGTAGVRVGGDSNQNQCTGYVEVHQDEIHGGGIFYNGDGSPSFASGETADRITYYRMTNGSRYEVFSYPHNSNNVEFNGSTTQNASDVRLKTNIKIIDNPIQKIKKIRGTTFDWVDDITSKYGFIPAAKHETGVIAQDIQDVIPDAVVTAPFNDIYTEKSGKDHNFLTVKPEKIIPLCIEAIKELSTEVENLKAEIAALKSS